MGTDRHNLRAQEVVAEMRKETVSSELISLRSEILALREDVFEMAKTGKDMLEAVRRQTTVVQGFTVAFNDAIANLREANAKNGQPDPDVETAIGELEANTAALAEAVKVGTVAEGEPPVDPNAPPVEPV